MKKYTRTDSNQATPITKQEMEEAVKVQVASKLAALDSLKVDNPPSQS